MPTKVVTRKQNQILMRSLKAIEVRRAEKETAGPPTTLCEPQAGGDDVKNGYGHQKLPAKAHQLVVTEPGKRSAHPDVQKKKTENLKDKPEYRRNDLEKQGARGKQRSEGTGPTAEEEQTSHTADGDHVGVFRHEEHGKLHGTVFRVVAGRELGFRLRKVERGAVGFRIGRHQVDEKCYELETAKDVPRNHAVGRLALHNGAQVERSGPQHHAHE